MSSQFFLMRNGKAFGPYSREQLTVAALGGNLKPEDQLASDVSRELRRAIDIPELARHFGGQTQAAAAQPSPAVPASMPAAPDDPFPTQVAGMTNAYWLKQTESPGGGEPRPRAKPRKRGEGLDPVMLSGGGLLAIFAIAALIGAAYAIPAALKGAADVQRNTYENVTHISSELQSNSRKIEQSPFNK